METSEAAYTLDNTWAKAHRRLTLIELMTDGGTTARLSRLGVGPGWRCLELGAGAGSVARWLADRVGAAGEVIAVDLEPRFLLADSRPNITVVQQDVVADGVPGEGYDLIHARALLMHLPNREELITDLVARLRPGGAILLEEGDFFPMLSVGGGALREVVAHACDLAVRRGGDWTWARRLPECLEAAGAVEVDGLLAEIPMVSAANLQGEFLALSLEQLAPLLLASGTSAALIEAAAAEIAAPGRWQPWFAFVTSSGRRPA